MPEKIVHFIGAMPFFLVVRKPGGDRIKVNWTRIVEALMIAGITAYFTGYISVAKLEVKFDMLSAHVESLDRELFEHMNKDKQ